MINKLRARDVFEKNRRFDLIYKILYLEHINDDEESKAYYKKLYTESIRIFNGFYENYPPKSCESDFINSFENTYYSILKNGYNDNEPIPINSEYELYDGAHRLAVSAVLDLTVPFEKIDHHDIFDFHFFKKRGIPNKLADIGALEYVKHNQNSYIVQLFPTVTEKQEKVVTDILNQYGFIYYKKAFFVNFNGLVQIKKINYGNEKWAGNAKNNYKGLRKHALRCTGFNKMRTLVFVCDNLEKVVKAKEQIRNYLKQGNYPIHINDFHDEAISLANIYFGSGGIDWLNSASYKYNKHLEDVVSEFSLYCDYRNKNKGNIEIVGSTPLTLYGLRDSSDIDCISRKHEIVEESGNVSSHITETKYYICSFEEMVVNHNYYLIVDGIKFLSLPELKAFKLRRKEWPKDYKDLWLMIVVKNIHKLAYFIATIFLYIPKNNLLKFEDKIQHKHYR